MFSVSIKSTSQLTDTIKKTADTINKYVKNNLHKKTLVINDDAMINIVTGKLDKEKDNQKIVAEVEFKYQFMIDPSDIENKQELDKFISYINRCLSNLSDIERTIYRPIHLTKGTE